MLQSAQVLKSAKSQSGGSEHPLLPKRAPVKESADSEEVLTSTQVLKSTQVSAKSAKRANSNRG